MNKRLALVGVVLLVLLVAAQGYQLYDDIQIARQRQALAEGAMDLMAKQRILINGVMDEYHGDAYGDKVDRIAEQQLIATEYQLQMLQVLALQNGEIIGLLYASQ